MLRACAPLSLIAYTHCAEVTTLLALRGGLLRKERAPDQVGGHVLQLRAVTRATSAQTECAVERSPRTTGQNLQRH
jgi:hypothetical protein